MGAESYAELSGNGNRLTEKKNRNGKNLYGTAIGSGDMTDTNITILQWLINMLKKLTCS